MSVFKHSTLVFESITPEIVHIRVPDRYTLASCLIRFQEHYESPHPEIRGKVFTLGQLKALGSRRCPGVFTYEGGHMFTTDWSGYNFPSETLTPFIKGLFDPLTKSEEDIVNALKCKPGKFYVIGTYGEDDPGETLDHEVCHALFYVNPKYKEEVSEAIFEGVESSELAKLYDLLREMGYCDEVLLDEAHAYLSADYKWLYSVKKEKMNKFGINIKEEVHKRLREIREKHFPNYMSGR